MLRYWYPWTAAAVTYLFFINEREKYRTIYRQKRILTQERDNLKNEVDRLRKDRCNLIYEKNKSEKELESLKNDLKRNYGWDFLK